MLFHTISSFSEMLFYMFYFKWEDFYFRYHGLSRHTWTKCKYLFCSASLLNGLRILEPGPVCLMKNRFLYKNRILYLVIFDLRQLNGIVIVVIGKRLLKMGKLELKKYSLGLNIQTSFQKEIHYLSVKIFDFFLLLPVAFLRSVSMQSPDTL